MALAPKASGSADKIIIANRSGMTTKYAANGVAMIDAALAGLVASDATRGLTTLIVDIDDQAHTTPYGVTPIISAADEAGAKRVVDAIDAHLSPDYFVLLDGPDVIPHITMSQISGLNDGDQDIPSDLPYACTAAFSNDANNYLAVTRVVGRIPMTKGSTDAAAFAKLIDLCTQQTPRAPSAYTSFFAMSADSWKVSTQLNLSTLFGSHAALNVSPTAGHAGIDQSLGLLTHLINCHGGTNNTRFYGQQGNNFPVAMDSSLVAPHVTLGTVAAAECCFGAEIFDPALMAGGDPMSIAYLNGGAAAYIGSTNKAYGPFNTNGQADLMVQFFLDAILKGASTGRAMLQARQRFVNSQRMGDPMNLKTLAQFVLYGDPSITPVTTAQASAPPAGVNVGSNAGAPMVMMSATATAKEIFSQVSTPADSRSARRARRIALKSEGNAVASAATFLGSAARPSGTARQRLETIAKQRGFSEPVQLFNLDGGPQFRRAAKSMGGKPQVAVICQTEDHEDPDSGRKHSLVRVLVAHILGDGIVALDEAVSR